MLEEDTVLSRFLRNNQVEADIQNKRMIIDGKNYPITTTDEQCLFCIEKREVRCGKFEKCDIREKMDSVGRKIYDLGGTLEFFVSGTKKDMERYSVLHFNPEILETLDQLLAKVKNKTGRKEPFALSFKLRKQKNEIYILQFPVWLTDIEGFCVCDYDNAYYEYEEILECNNKLFNKIMNTQILDKMVEDTLNDDLEYENSCDIFFRYAAMSRAIDKEKSYSLLIEGINNEALRPPYKGEYLMSTIMPGCMYFAYQNYMYNDDEIKACFKKLYIALQTLKKTTEKIVLLSVSNGL